MKLKAEKREVSGKQVKNLRAEGYIPASVYGPKLQSQNVQLDNKEFVSVYAKAGQSKFIDLELDGGKHIKVLVKDVNMHPLKDYYFDVQLYAVDEDTKLTVDVPVELTGEAPAVKQKLGFLMTPMATVAVHCLPKDLPTQFVLDVSKLENPGDTVSVSDIQLPEGVEFDSSVDPASAIAYISLPQLEIVEEVVTPVEGEEGTEGEAATEGTEGEEKKEEGSEE
jgi:large subunit ribosomal protein L25